MSGESGGPPAPQLSRAPPSLQDTEIINTAILTGRTVAIPVKVIAIEVTGLVLDVSALVECESDNEDIIKVGFLETGTLRPKLLTLPSSQLCPCVPCLEHPPHLL